jgi:hypothetical protein
MFAKKLVTLQSRTNPSSTQIDGFLFDNEMNWKLNSPNCLYSLPPFIRSPKVYGLETTQKKQDREQVLSGDVICMNLDPN